MVVVIAPCRTAVMHYGSFKPLSWPDKREAPRSNLGPRVLDRLPGNVHTAPRSNPLKRPAQSAAPNELEVIQRRLSQQLEEKQLVLRDSISQQQEQLSKLKAQLEEQTYSRVDPHIVNLHLDLLYKLEAKRETQEKILHDLEAAYSEKTGKMRTPPVNGLSGQMKYRNSSSPASAALSTPPSLSDRGDTESDSISSHDSMSLVAPYQQPQSVTTNFDSSHSRQVLKQQLSLYTDPNSSSSSSSSNSSGKELHQGGPFEKYQDRIGIMANGDCNPDSAKLIAPVIPLPGHNGALRMYGKDHVPDQHRSQYKGGGALHQEEQQPQRQQHQQEQQQHQLQQQNQQQQTQLQEQQHHQLQHQQKQQLQQQKQQQQQDFYTSAGEKSLQSEAVADSLRTFEHPPSSGPYLVHPPEHLTSMLGKPLVHHTSFPSAGQQPDRTMPFTDTSPPSSYQSISSLSNSHRPGQRETDGLHYPSTTPYLHQPNPHQLAHRLPLPPIRMGGRSPQQNPYNDYMQSQAMSNTSHHGDSLDHMAATLTGLGPSQNHTSALVSDSVLGFDSDELGQYMGPASNSQWLMGGQRQWMQPMNGIGQEYPLSQQDGGTQGGSMNSEQGYGWA